MPRRRTNRTSGGSNEEQGIEAVREEQTPPRSPTPRIEDFLPPPAVEHELALEDIINEDEWGENMIIRGRGANGEGRRNGQETHEEMHRRLHAEQHARALQNLNANPEHANQVLQNIRRGPPRQENAIVHNNEVIENEEDRPAASGSGAERPRVKKERVKVLKTKKKARTPMNHSRDFCDMEFTKTTVAKQTSTTTEQRAVDFDNGLIGVHLEEIPHTSRREERNMEMRESDGHVEATMTQRIVEEEDTDAESDSEEDEVLLSDGTVRAITNAVRDVLRSMNTTVLQCTLVAICAIILVPLASAALQINACCGDSTRCQNFTRAEDLFGVACCGVQPYNAYTQICCSGAVRERRQNGRYAELCCGTEVLGYEQTCCSGVVHNVANGDCCGTTVYMKSDTSLKCCNSTLARATSADDLCCGAATFDGGRTQICCGDSIFDKTVQDSCCAAPNGTFKEYNSATQTCCSTPIPKIGNQACCYLRQNGTMVPTSYDKTRQCCKFPFQDLSPMVGPNCTTTS